MIDTLLQVNGNDAICLTRNGMVIDMVGEANAGADVIWGLDLTLQRKNTITHPLSVYNKKEWNVLPMDSVAFIGTHSMALSNATPVYIKNEAVGKVTSFELTNLQPQSKYTYSVEAVIPGQNNLETLNTMQIETAALSAPVIMSADEVRANGFTANWEEDLYATSYLLDVFTTSGTELQTETEGFDAVGTNGTPLPTGWGSSTVSTYTSATSSGIAPPSIQLNTTGAWLRTKTYPAAVSQFTFMYRFASPGTGSSLLLEGFNGAQWQQIASYPYVNTSKYYPVYNFSESQNYRQFRFTYTKSSGNMAIDDVQASYGKSDTVFVERNREVLGNKYVVNNLTPNTTYYYRVKSKLGANTSVFSDVMTQKTLISTQNVTLPINRPNIKRINNSLIFSNISEFESVSIFDLTGKCIVNKSVYNNNETTISFDEKGVFIIQIRGEKGIYRDKVML